MILHGRQVPLYFIVRVGACFSFCLAALACASSPYGYAQVYEPASGEANAARDAQPFDPVMAQRNQRSWVGKRVSIFGVVKSVESAPQGGHFLQLSVRNLQPRNLCSDSNEDTCRVTVTERQFTTLYGLVRLKPQYTAGPDAVRPGSLVRVIGAVSESPYKKSGGTVVESDFFRHWPAQTYVTTAARSYMRQ